MLAGVDADGNPEAGYQTLTAERVSEDYLVRDRDSEGVDGVAGASSASRETTGSTAVAVAT